MEKIVFLVLFKLWSDFINSESKLNMLNMLNLIVLYLCVYV